MSAMAVVLPSRNIAMQRSASLFFYVVTVAFSTASVTTAVAQDYAQTTLWIRYVQEFDAYVRNNGIVGAGTLLVRNGRIAACHNVGLAERATQQPVDSNTIFHYGSITKTLTAITIMQLRDRGKLSLDEPATRYVPELR